MNQREPEQTGNRMSEINGILYSALKRLNDQNLKGKELQVEIDRAKAMGSVAEQIISNCAMQMKIKLMQQAYSTNAAALPEALED